MTRPFLLAGLLFLLPAADAAETRVAAARPAAGP